MFHGAGGKKSMPKSDSARTPGDWQIRRLRKRLVSCRPLLIRVPNEHLGAAARAPSTSRLSSELLPVYYRPEKSHVREIYLVEQRVVNRVSLAAHSNMPARDSRTAALTYTTLQINSGRLDRWRNQSNLRAKRSSSGRPAQKCKRGTYWIIPA